MPNEVTDAELAAWLGQYDPSYRGEVYDRVRRLLGALQEARIDRPRKERGQLHTTSHDWVIPVEVIEYEKKINDLRAKLAAAEQAHARWVEIITPKLGEALKERDRT